MSITSTIIQKVVAGAASIAIVGGGGALLNTQSRVSVLESHREDDAARLERIENKVDKLLERSGVRGESNVARNGK